jgi:hypothetical protein
MRFRGQPCSDSRSSHLLLKFMVTAFTSRNIVSVLESHIFGLRRAKEFRSCTEKIQEEREKRAKGKTQENSNRIVLFDIKDKFIKVYTTESFQAPSSFFAI